ncbi:hypothetical protein [Chryseobacterium sp. H1D6B]|uniref:hypothetical protein n=1 Tax=Chryseobacterium sp. H1D6B TaxID=2940588 RepID=UPI0015CB1901|nr:hypothetical protein [Chryseobacterium sp. H1D6B]
MFGQNSVNKELDKLFLDLDLFSNPESMTNKSSLRFEYGLNQTINWKKTDNSTGNYIADFDKNSLIESKIRKGLITIIPGDRDIQDNAFSVNERTGIFFGFAFRKASTQFLITMGTY